MQKVVYPTDVPIITRKEMEEIIRADGKIVPQIDPLPVIEIKIGTKEFQVPPDDQNINYSGIIALTEDYRRGLGFQATYKRDGTLDKFSFYEKVIGD